MHSGYFGINGPSRWNGLIDVDSHTLDRMLISRACDVTNKWKSDGNLMWVYVYFCVLRVWDWYLLIDIITL